MILTGLLALQWILTRNKIRQRRSIVKKHRQKINRIETESKQVLDQNNLFIRNLSFELKAPLTEVIATLKSFNSTGVPDWQQPLIKKLDLAADALERVVENLVDYAAVLGGALKLANLSFSLPHKVNQLCEELETKNQSDRVIFLGSSLQHLPTAKLVGDPLRLGEMLSAIINILKLHRREHTLLYFDSRSKQDDKDIVHVEFLIRGERLALSAKDKERILSALSQTALAEDFRFGDTCFSLFICHQLALKMNGGLQITSSATDALEFRLRIALPLAQETTALKKDMTSSSSAEINSCQ